MASLQIFFSAAQQRCDKTPCFLFPGSLKRFASHGRTSPPDDHRTSWWVDGLVKVPKKTKRMGDLNMFYWLVIATTLQQTLVKLDHFPRCRVSVGFSSFLRYFALDYSFITSLIPPMFLFNHAMQSYTMFYQHLPWFTHHLTIKGDLSRSTMWRESRPPNWNLLSLVTFWGKIMDSSHQIVSTNKRIPHGKDRWRSHLPLVLVYHSPVS